LVNSFCKWSRRIFLPRYRRSSKWRRCRWNRNRQRRFSRFSFIWESLLERSEFIL